MQVTLWITLDENLLIDLIWPKVAFSANMTWRLFTLFPDWQINGRRLFLKKSLFASHPQPSLLVFGFEISKSLTFVSLGVLGVFWCPHPESYLHPQPSFIYFRWLFGSPLYSAVESKINGLTKVERFRHLRIMSMAFQAWLFKQYRV